MLRIGVSVVRLLLPPPFLIIVMPVVPLVELAVPYSGGELVPEENAAPSTARSDMSSSTAVIRFLKVYPFVQYALIVLLVGDANKCLTSALVKNLGDKCLSLSKFDSSPRSDPLGNNTRTDNSVII